MNFEDLDPEFVRRLTDQANHVHNTVRKIQGRIEGLIAEGFDFKTATHISIKEHCDEALKIKDNDNKK